MNNTKFIGVWTSGLMLLSPAIRQEIEKVFNAKSKAKDDWFYKVTINGNDYFVADNGQFGYTVMLPEEY